MALVQDPDYTYDACERCCIRHLCSAATQDNFAENDIRCSSVDLYWTIVKFNDVEEIQEG